MNLGRVRADVEDTFAGNAERLRHTQGVLATALQLARKHRVSPLRAALAALLHDRTKPLSPKQHAALIRRHYPEEVLREYAEPLHHAFSAAAYAKEQHGIEDPEILRAIASHVVGRPGMSVLERILFISDYIEPNRPYEACRKVRPVAFEDLDLAVFLAMDNSITHFEAQGGHIPETAYLARDYYAKKGGNR